MLSSAECSAWKELLLKQANNATSLKWTVPAAAAVITPRKEEEEEEKKEKREKVVADDGGSSSSSSSSGVKPSKQSSTKIRVTGLVIRTESVGYGVSSLQDPTTVSRIRIIPVSREAITSLCSTDSSSSSSSSIFASKHEWLGYQVTVTGIPMAKRLLHPDFGVVRAVAGQVFIPGDRRPKQVSDMSPASSYEEVTFVVRHERLRGGEFDFDTMCVCIVDHRNRPENVCRALDSTLFSYFSAAPSYSSSSSSSLQQQQPSRSMRAWKHRWESKTLRQQSPLAAVFDWYQKREHQSTALFDGFELSAARTSEYAYAVELVWAMCLRNWIRSDELVAALLLNTPLPASILQGIADMFQRNVRVEVPVRSCDDGRVFVRVIPDASGNVDRRSKATTFGRRFQQYFGQEGRRICDILTDTEITASDVEKDLKRAFIEVSGNKADTPEVEMTTNVMLYRAERQPARSTKDTSRPTIRLVWNQQTNKYQVQ